MTKIKNPYNRQTTQQKEQEEKLSTANRQLEHFSLSDIRKDIRSEKPIRIDTEQWCIVNIGKPKKYLLSQKVTRFGTSIPEVEEDTNEELDQGDFGSNVHYMKVEKTLPMNKTDEKEYWNYFQFFQCMYCEGYAIGAHETENHSCEDQS